MKPSAFEYIRPRTVNDALAALQMYEDEAGVLAGGQSLVPLMNFRLARPSVVVDINDLTELSGIRVAEDGSLAVGAVTRQSVLLDFSQKIGWGLVTEGVRHIGHYPIRKRGTVGGSVAHADPAAELPAIVVALDAMVVLRSGRGERQVQAVDFFQGPFMTCRESDELLIEIRFPSLPEGTTTAFEEFSRRKGDFAITAVAVAVTKGVDGHRTRARVALAGVGPTPVRAHSAEDALLAIPGRQGIGEAAEEAVRGISPSDDVHGSARLRLRLARELLVRALSRLDGESG